MEQVFAVKPNFNTPEPGEPHWPIAQGYRNESCGCVQAVTRIDVAYTQVEVRVRHSVAQDCPHGHRLGKVTIS